MKKISLMLVAIMLLASTSAFALNETPNNNPSKELKGKVKKLLNGYFEMSSDEKFDATVIFTVNKEKEIVVLSVDSEDKDFCQFVKNKLNYKRVKIEGVVQGRRYTIPVTVQA